MVELRKEVEIVAEKRMNRLVKPGPVREAVMVPWRLDGTDRPPNVEVMAEVDAALGTMLGAVTPAEGYKRPVSRQSIGAATGVGSWAGVGVVQHQVHNVEGAGAEGEGEGAGASDHTELEGDWERHFGWGMTARGRRQVLEDGQENAPGGAQGDVPAEAQEGAPGEAQEDQTGELGETRVQRRRTRRDLSLIHI